RRADDARGVADDKRHLLGGAQRRRDEQVALAFAIVVIGDDDEFAVGEGMQNFLDRIGHESLTFVLGALAGLVSPRQHHYARQNGSGGAARSDRLEQASAQKSLTRSGLNRHGRSPRDFP